MIGLLLTVLFGVNVPPTQPPLSWDLIAGRVFYLDGKPIRTASVADTTISVVRAIKHVGE